MRMRGAGSASSTSAGSLLHETALQYADTNVTEADPSTQLIHPKYTETAVKALYRQTGYASNACRAKELN